MIIQLGKTYKTRSGHEVYIRSSLGYEMIFNIVGTVKNLDLEDTWMPNGSYLFATTDHSMDLVEEIHKDG